MPHRLPLARRTPEPRRWAVESCTLPARRRICEDLGCRYHLASDDDTRGRRRRTLEERKAHVAALPVTCALDVAHARATTVNAVAMLLGMSRHAIELVEERARAKLRASLATPEWSDGDEAGHDQHAGDRDDVDAADLFAAAR